MQLSLIGGLCSQKPAQSIGTSAMFLHTEEWPTSDWQLKQGMHYKNEILSWLEETRGETNLDPRGAIDTVSRRPEDQLWLESEMRQFEVTQKMQARA